MSLTVRAYNVLFGDCLLVSWKERDGKHHAWIDFGNFHNDKNAVFSVVYDDVLARTGGKLDLVVITHRHMDHLEGFFSLRKRFKKDFEIKKLWHAHVTPSVDGKLHLQAQAIRKLMPARSLEGGELARIFRNNFGDRGITTKSRMEKILDEFPVASSNVHTVHREKDVAAMMPPGLDRLRIEILAPEKNSKVYLEPLQPDEGDEDHAVNAATALGAPAGLERVFARAESVPATRAPLTKIAAFARVRRQLLATRGLDLLGAVDATRNNSSIVLRLTYRGRKRLLFTGDAEEKSWEVMRENGADLSSHLVKVGHHGSINATPGWSYKEVLTRRRKSNAALFSTDRTRFTGRNEVPKEEVLEGWGDRLIKKERLLRTDGLAEGKSVAVTYR